MFYGDCVQLNSQHLLQKKKKLTLHLDFINDSSR